MCGLFSKNAKKIEACKLPQYGPKQAFIVGGGLSDEERGQHFKPKREAAAAFKFHVVCETDDEKVPIQTDVDELRAVEQQPVWTKEETEGIEVTHRETKTVSDRLAWVTIQILRKSFDLLSGYSYKKSTDSIDEKCVLARIVFLETIAGVPPMMAGTVRHLQALRLMKRDGGWIATLLEEAENERMHLMIALSLRNPGKLVRGLVLFSQIGFSSLYFIAYLISPRFCHRFVGYLEEEAVVTYTHILHLLDAGKLPQIETLAAPKIAREYYQLHKSSQFREVMACIRADEAHHREVNHTLSDICGDEATREFPSTNLGAVDKRD